MNKFTRAKILEVRTKHLDENMKPLIDTNELDSYKIACEELKDHKTYLKYDIKFK